MMTIAKLGFANNQNVQGILCLSWSFGPVVAKTVTEKLRNAWRLAPNNGFMMRSLHPSITFKLTLTASRHMLGILCIS